MTLYGSDSAYYAASDAAERYRRDELAEHLQAAAEQERTGQEHRTDWKPAPRKTREQARGQLSARQTFKRAVADRDQGCVVHGNPADCAEGWQTHHVVDQQHLRRERADALWNPLAGMLVCGLVHRQHHSRVEPIPYDLIPLEVRDYLTGLGFGAYLERRYS